LVGKECELAKIFSKLSKQLKTDIAISFDITHSLLVIYVRDYSN